MGQLYLTSPSIWFPFDQIFVSRIFLFKHFVTNQKINFHFWCVLFWGTTWMTQMKNEFKRYDKHTLCIKRRKIWKKGYWKTICCWKRIHVNMQWKNNYAMIFPNGTSSMVYPIVAIHNKKPITSMWKSLDQGPLFFCKNCIIFLHIHLYIFSKLRAKIFKENHKILYWLIVAQKQFPLTRVRLSTCTATFI